MCANRAVSGPAACRLRRLWQHTAFKSARTAVEDEHDPNLPSMLRYFLL